MAINAASPFVTDRKGAPAQVPVDIKAANGGPGGNDGYADAVWIAGSQPGGYTSTATFTPAAAAYSAGDIMQGAREFTNIGPAGGEVLIVNTRLRVDASAIVSGETSYTLHLYSVTPPSALADNAVWDLPAGDRASYMGSVSLGTVVDLGSTIFVEQTGLTKQVTVPAGGSLFGYLVTNGGFTATGAPRTVLLKTLSA